MGRMKVSHTSEDRQNQGTIPMLTFATKAVRLFSVTLHDDNIQEFDTRWNEVLLSMSKTPSDDILESLYKLRIRGSAQLKIVLELYDIEIHQILSMPNYQKLKTMEKRRINQKLRLRNFGARHERIEAGAVVKNRKGLVGVEGGKGTCYQ